MSMPGSYDVAIDGRQARLTIDGSRFRYIPEQGKQIEREFSIESAAPSTFSVLVESRSYSATLLGDGSISVNGTVVPVEVFDPRALRTRGKRGGAEGRQTVAAPMPGRVIRVLVEVGQVVETGQGLLVVEAMKMQNEMKSPKAGKVTEVKTYPGAAVNAGEPLIVIE